MPQTRPTLKDIARALGVSATTVHRALHGKGGVSDDTSAEIRRVAARMGYQTNYMAAALKRKEVRLAVALPEPTMDSRYYYLSLWEGTRRFFREVTGFHVVPMEFYYPLTPEGNGAILKEIWERHGEEIDGLLTVAAAGDQSSYFLEKLAGRGIPILLVGADLHPELRLCCVRACDEMAGSLAAELLCAFHPGPFAETVVLTGNPVGSFAMVDQYYNVSGFEDYMARHAPGASLLRAYSANAQSSGRQVRALLEGRDDIYAVYCTSSRHTAQMSRLLESMGLAGRVKLIGNDRFPESLDALNRGIITAIVDKKIAAQSYRAAQILFNHVIKGEYPPSATVQIPPSILLQGNAGDSSGDCR